MFKKKQECCSYRFDPAESGELALRKGDVITVLNDCDADWWLGQYQGKQGIFPASYVA